MTDKEKAIEWLKEKKNGRITNWVDAVNWAGSEPTERFYNENKLIEAFLAGTHVDQWHYPSRGEYPTEGEEVLFRCDRQNYLGTYSNTSHYFDSRDMGSPASYVDCWQYIVPPEEEA